MSAAREFDRLSVVLVSTRNPLNIGAVARAMSNFGFFSLRLVNPYEPSFREARSAVGAAELLASAQEYTSVAEAVAGCTLVVGTTAVHHRDLQHPVHRLESAAGLIRDNLNSGRVALLFGSEKTGLSNNDLSYCHWLLHIATEQEHLSMNLGQAVAVCLHELARHCETRVTERPGLSEDAGLANAGELNRLTALWLESLQLSGYIKRGTEAACEENLRRMLRRLQLHAEDAQLWLGMLRQIVWKLRH
ncbi:MAG TPA: RNA methyltransferase [Candidatus Angelobacter sp.]|nr:RNA methyltransferase [Candidatus Angelobacter sp.]